MLSSYPYVPIGGEMGMNCAVLSYNGSLCVGFTGDAKAIPDIDRLPVLFAESFAELKSAAGIQPPKRRAPRRRVKATPEQPPQKAEEHSSTKPAHAEPELMTAAPVPMTADAVVA
jgi:hypothetical protein